MSDNFEWVEGSLQRFGAYTVDFDEPALPRSLNKMGSAYQEIVAARAVSAEIWDRWVKARFPTDGTSAGVGSTTREPQVGVLPTR